MARPIPAQIMRSEITVKVCSGTDIYQEPAWEEYTVKRVHIQPAEEIRKTADNTDSQLKAVLFVDEKVSAPRLDWAALLTQAHDLGGDMRVICRGVEYTVISADELRDEKDLRHHWEVGLI